MQESMWKGNRGMLLGYRDKDHQEVDLCKPREEAFSFRGVLRVAQEPSNEDYLKIPDKGASHSGSLKL